ncbi:HAD family hydrolase [Methylophaga sp. OBS1]|uniref:histidinol-phosphatase n=1 Tax=Methylophaga sp. OBS1 TaxID=2991933 RepID=UPI00224E1774|nr:HAD family hydrolase [Methylophaga sp. OBS1]MCX4192662.1 HAD-IB family hydrolase [Methylophaga sp. OBS1]
MALAIFDLDNTLLGGDSDFLWGRYLCENGIVDEAAYRRANEHYYQQYLEGSLDIYEFLEFVFKPLASHDMQTLEGWREAYLEQKIKPILQPAAEALVDKHRKQGDTLLIITATNSFLTTPIAQMMGIDNLIATDPEIVNGRFSGRVAGQPSFQHGKVERLRQWLQSREEELNDSIFYSDSHNDLPLLELVDTPVAVDPDPKLQAVAQQRGWQILSLR